MSCTNINVEQQELAEMAVSANSLDTVKKSNLLKFNDDETIIDEEINKTNEHKIDNVELQDHVKTITLSLFKQVNEDLKFDETNEISNYDE